MNFQTFRTLYYRPAQEWRVIVCTRGHTGNINFILSKWFIRRAIVVCVTVGKSKIVGAKIHLCFLN